VVEWRIERLESAHVRQGFDCGKPSLNGFLHALVSQYEKRNLGRTYVALQGEDQRVLGFHKLRTRQSGSHRHADVHVMLSDELTFREAHAITEDIEDDIRAALPNLDVIVHAEPF
jgi:divalent metal cation (Fe/Co/Zn/Cd) transporter